MSDKKDQNPAVRKTLSSLKDARHSKSVRSSFASLKGKNQDLPVADKRHGGERPVEVQKANDPFERAESSDAVSNEQAARLPDFQVTGESAQKLEKRRRLFEKGSALLQKESWSTRHGHSVTFVAVFLFTVTLYFRPYELVPSLAAFNSVALIFGVATLLIYLPSQMALEGSISFFFDRDQMHFIYCRLGARNHPYRKRT